MGVPAPPYPAEYMGTTFLQRGGPISVGSGATTAAITFGTAFPDTNYRIDLEWVSGAIAGAVSTGYLPGAGARNKTVASCIVVFSQVVTPSAFLWGAWRLT